VKTTPHAGRGNSAQTGAIADVTEQRANEHENQLLQQNTWRETCSSKQTDNTPCEVESNFTRVMKILIGNLNGFYFIKCTTACDFTAY
jgi:hypothetical protein